jgi:hypothetical protein
MSLRNHRAAATALIGLLAGGVPVSVASAATSNRDNPVDPAPGYDAATTPATTLTPPATGNLSTEAQCGQVTFTNTLPTMITCGPVTMTFNTLTVTTTTTTLSAPITAANGPVTTTALSTPAPATARRRQPTRSGHHVKPNRAKHRTAKR